MIIGFTGQPGAGKSTAAKILYLQNLHLQFRFISFAEPVYDILAKVFSTPLFIGDVPSSTHEYRDQVKKSLPDKYGNTPRELLRAIGEFGRREIHADVWVDIAMAKIKPNGNYIFDDVRFPNEALAILDRGGKIYEIVKPDLKPSGHFSDNSLTGYDFPKITASNYADLQKEIKSIISL